MKIDDRWVWLGLGAAAFFAVQGIAHGLHEVVRLTEVSEVQKQPRSVSQETEDDIKLESLKALATSSNVEIRKAATKILCNRFLRHPSARSLIAEDLYSSSSIRRARALRAIQLIDRHTGSTNWRFPMPRTPFTAPLPESPTFSGARTRRLENSEEQALRRRRREAMVFNEGDRPVSQDDIIQRGGGVRDEESQRMEDALADLVEREAAGIREDFIDAPMD